MGEPENSSASRMPCSDRLYCCTGGRAPWDARPRSPGRRAMAVKKSSPDVDLEPVGPGTLAGRSLRRFWPPVSRAQDLPAGRAKPTTVLGERFTLYRAED